MRALLPYRPGRSAVAAVAVTVLAAVVVPGTAAAAQGDCDRPPEPLDTIAEVPWAQEWLAPDRVWPLSQGDGVVVAVVDSGVDTGHAQLDGRVRAGADFDPGGTDGRVDCDGHGTAVASVVAASPVPDVGFAGLAPGAEILPVRVVERGTDSNDPDRPAVDPDGFADAIRWAAENGAQVINASIVFRQDYQEIAEAVEEAVESGVIVVAAVGNTGDPAGDDATPYPAAYPGVIGVGAIAADGQRLPESRVGPYVDLVAPGADVTVAAAGGGHLRLGGTSFAAPFVSAAAALLLAREPDLSGDQVVGRLLATADAGPGSVAESGHGLVDLYGALTQRAVDAEPVAAQPPPEPVVDPVAQARAERWRRAVSYAVLLTVAAVVLAALGFTGGSLWRRGRRGGWRPTRAAASPPEPPRPASDDPEQRFFTVPTPRGRR